MTYYGYGEFLIQTFIDLFQVSELLEFLEACETQEREKVKRDVFLAAIDVLCEHLILCA